MTLWIIWLQSVHELRPACARLRTFAWMALALAGLCIRNDRLGVTSLVRSLNLDPSAYHRFLHLFHSNALDLEALTAAWLRLSVRLFGPLEVDGALVVLADGVKAPKEGRKMPGVKSLHQESENNNKSPFIMGHSLQALSLLVQSRAGEVAAVPLTARIHEGLVFSNRDKRTLLDKLAAMLLANANHLGRRVLLIADAYYASGKVINPLLAKGHHLLTRARINTVAFECVAQPAIARRGRPRLYGKKVRLRDLARAKEGWLSAPSPIPGEKETIVKYRHADLLWRPVGKRVRFVIVQHPKRGTIILMATDLTRAPLEILLLYSYRFKIEVGFRQAIQVLGAYAYHFWMKGLKPIRRRGKNQYLHRETEAYRKNVKRKMGAYHRYIQLGCIAQGLLLHLAVNHPRAVWAGFRSWLRTMNPGAPPSELVVSCALRESWPDFLASDADTLTLRKILHSYRRRDSPNHAETVPCAKSA